MEFIYAFFAPLLYILGLTGSLIYLCKKRFNFQFLLPLAIITATLFVYFFTCLFHHITAGVIITAALALAFIPLVVLDKDRSITLRTLFFTPAFVIFLVLYTFLFLFHFGSVLAIFSDDTMHWAPHVWTMWLRDDFYTSPGVSIVTHGDYPPILQLFQLIFCRVAGAYREGFLYVALEITCFSMLFPILKNLTWQNARKGKTLLFSLLVLLAFMALPVSLDVTSLFYNALHPDYAIAFVFVLGIYLAMTQSRRFSWTGAAMISATVAFLSLTKQSSVLFGGLVVLLYFSLLYLHYDQQPLVVLRNFATYLKVWRKNWGSLLIALILLVIPVAALKLWAIQIQGFKAPYCCVAIFHVSPTDALQVPDVLLKKTGDPSQQSYARKFFKYILTYQAGFTTQILSGVSYAQFILLFVGAMVFVGYNYKDKYSRKRIMILAVIMTAGWFVYGFAIYLTFLFGGMIDSERDNLLTGDRYLRTYTFAMLLVLFGLTINFAINRYNEKKTATKAVATFAIGLAVVLGLLFNIDILKSSYVYESLKFDNAYSANGIDNLSSLSTNMRAFSRSIGLDFKHPKKVSVTGAPNNQAVYLNRYLLIPNRMNNGSDIVLGSKINQNKVCATLRGNDYLFISYQNQKYLDTINNCTTTKLAALKEYQAFKITKMADGLVKLTEWKY